jgi:ClpP class serine protease
MGKYKSGGEALTQSAPGEDSLRNLKETLGDLRAQWLLGVSAGRKDPEERKQQAEDGPWSPKRAQELGLVERVGFEDEALEAAKARGGTAVTEALFGDHSP